MTSSDQDDIDDRNSSGATYAGAGVNREASETATAAIAATIGDIETDEFAGLLDIGGQYLALATDGVGTKLLVADALSRYDTIGIDCIAMNVNDLVAMGIEPLGFVDYLAMDEPDDTITGAIGEGLATGATQANIELLGGELAILPEIVDGFDLAGACVGIADEGELFDGTASVGETLVGFQSSGIHSNGLTLARQVITAEYSYTDPFPMDTNRQIGDVLLEPTCIYTDLLDPLRECGARAVAHITGGGWTNVGRLGSHAYIIDNPFPSQPIFDLIADAGDISTEEMHRTFNMGTGLVVALEDDQAEELVGSTEGVIIGHVESGNTVDIRGESLSI